MSETPCPQVGTRARWRGSLPVLVVALLASPGCAPSLSSQWLAPDTIPRPTAAEAGVHDAVVALRHDTVMQAYEGGSWFQQSRTHQVVAVLRRRGPVELSLRLGREPERLVDLRARLIAPDGSVTPVDAAALRDAAEKTRGREATLPVSVPVGGLLEYAWTVDSPHASPWWWTRPGGELPILDYRLTFRGSKVIRYAFRAYQSPGPFVTHTDGDMWQVEWRARDIPPRSEDEDAPHWSEREPWWIYRITGYAWPGGVEGEARDWPEALRGWADPLLDHAEHSSGGVEPLVLDPGCRTATCRVQGAWESVHAAVAVGDHVFPAWPAPRPLAEILTTARADNFEMAVLLRKRLLDVGIDAQLAALGRADSMPVDGSFPTSMPLGHLVVYLPAQGDLSTETWIDPSCAWCRPGELPPWSHQRTAIRLRARPNAAEGTYAVEAKVAIARGPRAAPSTETLRYTAHVALAGPLTVDVERTLTGAVADALIHESSRWSESDWAGHLRRTLRLTRWPGAGLEAGSAACGDRRTARCVQSFQLRLRDGVRAGPGRLDVPLAMLGTDFDRRAQVAGRRSDLVFHEPLERREEVVFRVPDGYRAGSLPPARSVAGAGFTFTLAAEVGPDGVRVIRTLSVAPGRYGPDRQPEIGRVLTAYRRARRASVVFHRPEEGWAMAR